ncbi:MAG: transcriptional regulator [Alphaproteobacteria bacterium RIFCSPLOWO2_01_FULL_40_26]|nr:MAG: transcriptional regulator [Alphaproteobacteria bacterium RIFCSPHIGHO2_02_FULL_40_34]OFW87531.1 MAG: transcriptional regulator [Alphaproteobacteria bacterium RIFCSPHIGHO2_01_FULL_40_8]OFW94359.1 MAG: transcriptional regulator [Alphaproteobacteria bacterium RIFCSPLOWO2_01_FULL_40_26]OFX09493.1 MAG: transcriptional regulator [Alphaproteobacteria bacterium RIFCSPLOWO2_02_FULL_40_19]OFX11124.1 MAG: transcriptional regulator [Alphaproteobacteria bacterium RIFCSPLOWO2_12_FULL_40_11]
MPEISRFFGIKIFMYFDDHNPSHFHAIYGEWEALIAIEDLKIIKGELPPRAYGLVVEWASIHKRELEADWKLTSKQQIPNKIKPLS